VNSTWDIVVVGSANTDFIARGSQLPKPGETTMGKMFQMGQGGKGANQAVAAARLGARVTFVGRVGSDDRGDAMLAQLRDVGVHTDNVIRDPDTPTGAAVIHVDESGEKQIFVVPNANDKLTVDDMRGLDSLRNTKVLMAQLEIPLDTVMEAARIAHEAGAKVVLDPAPPIDLPDELLRWLTVIKPNSSEAERLTGVQVSDRQSARKAAEKLLERGVAAVAIQAGSDGNLLVWQQGEHWLPKHDVKSVDATGAGDAFAAAMAVALSEGRSWEEAGELASATAALATTKLGAQTALPERREVRALIAQSS